MLSFWFYSHDRAILEINSAFQAKLMLTNILHGRLYNSRERYIVYKGLTVTDSILNWLDR